ncbi:putative cyclin-B3-1 [Taenia crassiceps]|uniref:Cyclin-B3-1 n=1 Tax=Taenia crassiceps TaxID=6207 RepID=A0ABR4Q3K3_9CEST
MALPNDLCSSCTRRLGGYNAPRHEDTQADVASPPQLEGADMAEDVLYAPTENTDSPRAEALNHIRGFNFNYVDEVDEVYYLQLLARSHRRNRGSAIPMGVLPTHENDDPLTRGDLRFYLTSLTENFELDNRYMEAYNPQFLARCEISPDTRDCLIQWMIQLHMWMRIPVQTLHVAVGLMDLYTWLRPILLQEYQLLALGAIKLATRIRSPTTTISNELLSRSAMDAYIPSQIARMEEKLQECAGNRANFPTPFTFLERYMLGLSDFSFTKLEWTRKICQYFFDLGLCHADLCQYSASMRCAGVLYLIRCMQQLGYSPDFGHKSAYTPPWSCTMEKFTGHSDTKHLRRVAKLYGQKQVAIGVYAAPYYLNHHTNVPHMRVRQYRRLDHKDSTLTYNHGVDFEPTGRQTTGCISEYASRPQLTNLKHSTNPLTATKKSKRRRWHIHVKLRSELGTYRVGNAPSVRSSGYSKLIHLVKNL